MFSFVTSLSFMYCVTISVFPVNMYLTRTFATSTLIKYVTEVYLQVLLMKIVIDKISKCNHLLYFLDTI